MIKNIIFDWSGVISDDIAYGYKAMAIVMNAMLNKTISREEYEKEITLPAMNFWKKYIPNLDKEKEEEINKLFLNAINQGGEADAYENAKEVLKKLYSKKLNMIIMSAFPQEKLLLEAKKYGLLNYFQEINGGINNKIVVIKEILERNNFKPNETLYIGDMIHDIHAGKEGGVTTISLTSGYGKRSELEKENPDYIISDLRELLKLV